MANCEAECVADCEAEWEPRLHNFYTMLPIESTTANYSWNYLLEGL